jgi:hypothetical protein
MNSLPKLIIRSLVVAALSVGSATAAVVVALPTPSSNGSLQITQDISFTVTVGGQMQSLVFNEWLVNDGNYDGIDFTLPIAYTVNGGSVMNVNSYRLGDNTLGYFGGNVTADDGHLIFASAISLLTGDVFTLKAGTYTLPQGSYPNYNPLADQTFSGDVFLANTSHVAMTALTPVEVPEPTRAVLLLGGMTLTMSRRRRVK